MPSSSLRCRATGSNSALLILAEIDGIRRFPHQENLWAYAGLVPTVRRSASSVYYGAINKSGSSYFGWTLTEAAHTHRRCEPDSQLSRLYAKVVRRRGKQKAIVATAKKPLIVIYWVLRTREPYHCQEFNLVFPSARTSGHRDWGRSLTMDETAIVLRNREKRLARQRQSDRRPEAN
jgi:hypothetical protein